MALPSYFTGTVSVEAGGTTVTGSGTIWTGGNAREGDDFVIAGTLARIVEVVSATSLTITPWTGATKSGAEYVIYQNAARRFDDVRIADDLRKQVAALNNQGYPHIVPNDAAAPDPSLGDEGQPAIQFDSWKWWQKQGGVWDPKGTPAGLLPANALSEIAALGLQEEARENLGATEIGDGIFTAVDAAAARTNLGATEIGDGIFTAVDAAAARTNLGAFGAIKRTVITSTGTHTFDQNMIFALIETQGGGGGGGGVQGAVGDARGGGGGAAGNWSTCLVTKAQAGATKPVAIGAAGVGQVGNTGTAGGATSVGTLCVANGGGGGVLNNWSSGFGQGGSAGAAGTGDIAPRGQGGDSASPPVMAAGIVKAGNGGGSRYGGGGAGPLGSGITTGSLATGFGAGGSGGVVVNSTAFVAGGNGSPGLVIITEFCSK